MRKKLIGVTLVLLFLPGGATKGVKGDDYVPDLGVSLDVAGWTALSSGQTVFLGKLHLLGA